VKDPWGALLDEPFPPVRGADDGPLPGVTFVAKDLFDLAGFVTGAGQPTWAATHAPAEANAPAVQRLLDGGATLVGRAHTAQMAYSLSGRDDPYGMPVNPAAPAYDTGGSSSGSAAAVAGGLAELGLGTDTLGSIRVPASYGGLFGWRPTHGLIPLDGVHPLAPSLDTVGLLARDPDLLQRAAGVLAGDELVDDGAGRVLVAAEAFTELDPHLRDELLALAQGFGPTDSVDLAPGGVGLLALTAVVRDVQGPEFAAVHRAWIEAERPTFVPGVAERIAHALAVTPEAHAAANEVRAELRDHLAAVLGPTDVVVVPLAGRPARRDGDDDAFAVARRIAASLSVVGSLGGLPTVAVPAVHSGGTPVGLGLLGAPGSDARLLRLAAGRPPGAPANGPAPA
jgi:amidase